MVVAGNTSQLLISGAANQVERETCVLCRDNRNHNCGGGHVLSFGIIYHFLHERSQ